MSGKLIILAGGISSRMKRSVEESTTSNNPLLEQANVLPKGMLTVGKGGRPFLDYLIYNAYRAGYEDMVIIVNDQDKAIREYYTKISGTEKIWKLTIRFAIQKIPAGLHKPQGTADALLQALEQYPHWKDSSFTVCNSDNLYSQQVLKILADIPHPCATIGYDREGLHFEEERIRQFALLRTDADNYLLDIVEKPTEDEAKKIKKESGSCRVSMNIFKFDYNTILPVLKNVPLHPQRKEKELPVAVKMLVQQRPRAMLVIGVSEKVPDLTSKSDIAVVQQYLSGTFYDIS